MNESNIFDDVLSSSPTSVTSSILSSLVLGEIRKNESKISLQEFCNRLPQTISKKHYKKYSDTTKESDPLQYLLAHLEISPEERDRYHQYISSTQNYTRNLISTDNQTYTLLLLCWNPKAESPIHDHPCDGCWMKVIQGAIREKRYIDTSKTKDGATQKLIQTSDKVFNEEQVAYIDDNIGLHKICNDGEQVAMSIHLYTPPIQKCRVWFSEDNALSYCTKEMTNDSEFGVRL